MANPNPNMSGLVPVTERTPREQQEISAKGGAAGKGLRRYGQMKCKNCRLPCPFREQGERENWRCQIKSAQRKIIETVIDPQNLIDSLIMDAFELQTRAGTDFGKILESFYAKLSLKKEIAPSVQPVVLISADLRDILEVMQRARERNGSREKRADSGVGKG